MAWDIQLFCPFLYPYVYGDSCKVQVDPRTPINPVGYFNVRLAFFCVAGTEHDVRLQLEGQALKADSSFCQTADKLQSALELNVQLRHDWEHLCCDGFGHCKLFNFEFHFFDGFGVDSGPPLLVNVANPLFILALQRCSQLELCSPANIDFVLAVELHRSLCSHHNSAHRDWNFDLSRRNFPRIVHLLTGRVRRAILCGGFKVHFSARFRNN